MENQSDELEKAIKSGDYTLASDLVLRLWLDINITAARANNPELSELTFLKTAVDTGDGKYLLSFIHVDGNKINLRE